MPTAPLPLVVLVGGAARLKPELSAAYTVVTAETAAAGFAATVDRDARLVLSSLHLPDGDGLALSASIHDDPRTTGVPVVLLSPSAQRDAALALALALAAGPHRPPAPAADALPDDAFLTRVLATAREHLADPAYGARELAADIGLSPRQFRRRFAEATGESPRAFLRRLRLESAAALLSRGVPAIKEVAYRCGFASTSGFRAAFREAYGMSPSEYQRSPAEHQQEADPVGVRPT